MRIKTTESIYENEKVVSYFAIFPVWIDNEMRWLEKVVILKRYQEDIFSGYGFWIKYQFMN